jgi:hypothetical protein
MHELSIAGVLKVLMKTNDSWQESTSTTALFVDAASAPKAI